MIKEAIRHAHFQGSFLSTIMDVTAAGAIFHVAIAVFLYQAGSTNICPDVRF